LFSFYGISQTAGKLDLGFGNLFFTVLAVGFFFLFNSTNSVLVYTLPYQVWDIGIHQNWGNHFSDFTWRMILIPGLMAEKFLAGNVFLDRITLV